MSDDSKSSDNTTALVDERTPYEIARERLEHNRKVAMRSGRLHSKPMSTMPATSTGTHGLYTQLASLQMSKARQEKIREALLEQVARCEEEIARVEVETDRLRNRIDEIDARSRRSVTRESAPKKKRPADSVESLEEAFRFKY